MNNKLLLSITEVSELLGISRPSTYQLAHRADFPVVHLGGADARPSGATETVAGGPDATGA